MPLNRGLNRFSGPPQPGGLPWSRINGRGTVGLGINVGQRPAAGPANAGMFWISTNASGGAQLFYSTGTAWTAVAPEVLPIALPTWFSATGWGEVSAYCSVGFSATNGAWTTIQLDTEVTDPDGLFNPATYTFTPGFSGLYLVDFGITVSGPSRVIGSVWTGTASEFQRTSDGPDTLGGEARLLSLVAGTGYTFRVFVSGATGTVFAGSSLTFLTIRRIR